MTCVFVKHPCYISLFTIRYKLKIKGMNNHSMITVLTKICSCYCYDFHAIIVCLENTNHNLVTWITLLFKILYQSVLYLFSVSYLYAKIPLGAFKFNNTSTHLRSSSRDTGLLLIQIQFLSLLASQWYTAIVLKHGSLTTWQEHRYNHISISAQINASQTITKCFPLHLFLFLLAHSHPFLQWNCRSSDAANRLIPLSSQFPWCGLCLQGRITSFLKWWHLLHLAIASGHGGTVFPLPIRLSYQPLFTFPVTNSFSNACTSTQCTSRTPHL